MDEFLDKLKELSEALTPISDMAVLLGMCESELREKLLDPECKAGAVYRRSIAATALEFRKQEIELAKAASPTAMEAVRQHLKRIQVDL